MTLRRLLAAGFAVVLLGVLAAGSMLVWGSAAEQPAATPNLPAATAEIVRTTLVDTRTVDGTLSHGEHSPVSANVPGTLTWLPAVGSIVEQGEPLFKVDEQPVIAIQGTLPFYRTLERGVEGEDVRQLEEALAALGYGEFTVDERFTRATADAVSAWQADLGLEETGVVEPGQVVFLPGPVRVAEHQARVGDRLEGRGQPVTSVSGTDRLVTAELTVRDQALAELGREVSVTLPGGATAEGRIADVATVVVAGQGGGGNQSGELRLELTIEIADQASLGSLDAAPVELTLISAERRDVLAVPLSALLALAGGGYGVEVIEGSTSRIVPVTTGMFAGGRVEISGEGLVEGMRVGVPR
jgi:membrane fusion protein, multidrug efflux system